MTNSKKLMLVLLLIISAALVLWVISSRDIQQKFNNLLNEKSVIASFPISYITNTKTQQYNQQGLLSYTLNAKIIRQFEIDDMSTPDLIIDNPYLTIYDLSTDTSANSSDNPDAVYHTQASKKQSTAHALIATSTISADVAEGFESNDKLTLKGNVVVVQILKNGGPRELKTSVLYLEPSRRYAQTDKPVIITDASGTINATGMKIFFDEQRVELLSTVVGRYSYR
jgi:lipopolysaccharide export system protein LptC